MRDTMNDGYTRIIYVVDNYLYVTCLLHELCKKLI